jgi:hypothetical protein
MKRVCTLGENVPSCEKKSMENKNFAGNSSTDGKLQVAAKSPIYRNGTSFATQIAVAIASIVLGFMDDVERNQDITVREDFEYLMKRLRTKTGIESVLSETCVLQGIDERPPGYSYITPWFFLRIEKSSRVGIIPNLLKNVSG